MIPRPSDSNELLSFVRDWFHLISVDRWEEACASIDRPNCYGIIWTPALIREAIDLAFPPGCIFRSQHPEALQITEPLSASGRAYGDVIEMDTPPGYSVELSVPLNGEWSDLTAQFEFMHHSDDTLLVCLHGLHVL